MSVEKGMTAAWSQQVGGIDYKRYVLIGRFSVAKFGLMKKALLFVRRRSVFVQK